MERDEASTAYQVVMTHKKQVRDDLLVIKHQHKVGDIRGFVKIDWQIKLDNSVAEHFAVQTKYISSSLALEWVENEVMCSFDGVVVIGRLLEENREKLMAGVLADVRERA